MPIFGKSALQRMLAVLLVLAVLSSSAGANTPSNIACKDIDYNAMILEIIDSLPKGGGYEVRGSRVALPAFGFGT